MKLSEREQNIFQNLIDYFLNPKRGHGALLPSDVQSLQEKLQRKKRRQVTHFVTNNKPEGDWIGSHWLTSCGYWYDQRDDMQEWYKQKRQSFTKSEVMVTCSKCCKKLGKKVPQFTRMGKLKKDKPEKFRHITLE